MLFVDCPEAELLVVVFADLRGKMESVQGEDFIAFLKEKIKTPMKLAFIKDHSLTGYLGPVKDLSADTFEESLLSLSTFVKAQAAKKVVFIGSSVGGFAGLLFGTLLKVDDVVAYCPPTKCDRYLMLRKKVPREIVNKYSNVQNLGIDEVRYHFICNPTIQDSYHLYSYCADFQAKNKIVHSTTETTRQMMDNGWLLEILEPILKV